MMPLMLPHCLSTDKKSLQTHQQHQVEATLPRINQTHQRFTQANSLQLTDSMSSFSILFLLYTAAFAALFFQHVRKTEQYTVEKSHDIKLGFIKSVIYIKCDNETVTLSSSVAHFTPSGPSGLG